MRLVAVNAGVLEIRWTWLPLWLAANPRIKKGVETELRDAVLLGGVTDSEADMDAMHRFVVDRFQRLFPDLKGLGAYLDGLRHLDEGKGREASSAVERAASNPS